MHAGGECPVPYSVFTGGCDIWIDAGNKAEGVAMLQGLLNLKPKHCLHVGDQFDLVGNDLAARLDGWLLRLHCTSFLCRCAAIGMSLCVYPPLHSF